MKNKEKSILKAIKEQRKATEVKEEKQIIRVLDNDEDDKKFIRQRQAFHEIFKNSFEIKDLMKLSMIIYVMKVILVEIMILVDIKKH